MGRTVVYRRSAAGNGGVVFGQPGAAEPADGYLDRLIKYVPAEVVAFYAPTAATAGTNRGLLLAVVAAGVVATPGYLWFQSRRQPADERPFPHFFVIATLAFLVWALATSAELASTIGLDARTVMVSLAITILIVPALDAGLAQLWLKLRRRS